MRLIDIYAQLQQLKLPVLQTQDVATYFNINIAHASKLLSRLSNAKQIIHIGRGIWAFPEIDPLILPSFLTRPFPSYISLQTALYYHGMISQIPNTIYAVSLARSALHKTPLADISIHHIQPSFFFGFEENENGLLKIATPEKTLLDVLYLSQTKSRLFHTLPELELPKAFKITLVKKMILQISSVKRRMLVEQRFFELLDKTLPHTSGGRGK